MQEARLRFSAHHERSYVKNQGAAVEEEPHLPPATIGLLRPGYAPLQAGEVGLQRRHEAIVNVLAQVRLVVLDRQDVVAAAGDDLGGDLLLAAHRVDRYQGPLEVEQLQQ